MLAAASLEPSTDDVQKQKELKRAAALPYVSSISLSPAAAARSAPGLRPAAAAEERTPRSRIPGGRPCRTPERGLGHGARPANSLSFFADEADREGAYPGRKPRLPERRKGRRRPEHCRTLPPVKSHIFFRFFIVFPCLFSRLGPARLRCLGQFLTPSLSSPRLAKLGHAQTVHVKHIISSSCKLVLTRFHH